MPFRFVRKSGGFTLIELIVSIAILSMLSLAFIRQSEMTAQKHKNQEYINAIETVMGYMRTARTNAITNKVTSLAANPGELGVPPGGYGTHIELLHASNEIRITEFVDDHNNAGDATPDGIFSRDSSDNPTDMILNSQTIKTFWLTTLERPRFVTEDPGNVDPNALTVIFLPAAEKMNINDNDDTESHAFRSVDLVFNFNGPPKRICLNRVSKYIETISGTYCNQSDEEL
jgi:prepilin-type N-terminal cleavage/methylation domain-containing protein